MGNVHFEIYYARDGWRWRLWASNGRIVAESGEAYVEYSGAENGVNWVKTWAPDARVE